ncbi:MAG: S-methyl-5'-thioinosine phosphorylase [Chromatiales bacterium]|jgi:5'-methylthioinosine phosphorylase|nr:S-methyl-5'-thioinosine phosphorylase [Chromatiales bacterium]
MPDLAIIGGTGLTSLKGLEIVRREVMYTPYGEPSGPLTHGILNGKQVVFLARHGYGHNIPPHLINYRANLWALKEAGVSRVVAVAAVGGIATALPPGGLAIPDQLIDYTWGRASTFFDQDLTHVTHVDFSWPYDAGLRELLIRACRKSGIEACEHGVYGVTQGPRLETVAEIDRMERDGCAMVGMTAMPEAALARELDMAYATFAVAANWAAGRAGLDVIQMEEIERTLREGMERVRTVLTTLVALL